MGNGDGRGGPGTGLKAEKSEASPVTAVLGVAGSGVMLGPGRLLPEVIECPLPAHPGTRFLLGSLTLAGVAAAQGSPWTHQSDDFPWPH